MKILKVKVKKKRVAGHCRFSWPERWDAQKIHVLAYEDRPDNLGDVAEECLCVTDDETVAKLLEQPEVKEISVAKANAFGRQWRPNVAVMTEEEKVINILRKLLLKSGSHAALKKYLTEKEIDSLDETKNELGIERGKEFDISQFI